MSKAIIEITGQIELTYDENAKEFKEALKDFREIIDSTGTIEDMLKHVAFNITRFGVDTLVEGVGYVGYNGRIPKDDTYSGIMVGKDFDEYSFEIQ